MLMNWFMLLCLFIVDRDDIMKDLFGNPIQNQNVKNGDSLVRELLSCFQGKVLTPTEINLLPKSVRYIK